MSNQFEFLDYLEEKVKNSNLLIYYSENYEIRGKIESLRSLLGGCDYYRYNSSIYKIADVHDDYSYCMMVRYVTNKPEKFVDFDKMEKSRSNLVFGILISEDKLSNINTAKYALRLTEMYRKYNSESEKLKKWNSGTNNIRIFVGDKTSVYNYIFQHGGHRIEGGEREIFAAELGINDRECFNMLTEKFIEIK